MSDDTKRANTESADSAAASPRLRNAASTGPGDHCASLESTESSVRAYDEDEIAHTVPCSCCAWSRHRVRLCLCGCARSATVLVVRLLLDWHAGTTCVIHSFIIYFDMTLIHLFTSSPWLSASGEVVTYLAVIAFYCTKHLIFELLETVCIAALCSVHLIRSRNKHADRERALQEELAALKQSRRSARALPDLEGGGPHDATKSRLSIEPPTPPYSLAPKRERRRWREDFYDHFLDGAAGVMYTSILGLILDDLIQLHTNYYK